MNNYTSEAGHWYDMNGQPCYDIQGQNGNIRSVTIRDARKMQLLPSVTGILQILPKTGLQIWKINQGIISALTSPHIKDYIAGKITEKDFLSAIKVDAQEEAVAAAKKGKGIHAAIEKYFSVGEIAANHETCIQSMIQLFDKLKISIGKYILAEKSFASDLGYGGKIDLVLDNVVIDFKTKDFSADEKIKTYDEQLYQLCAYAKGIGMDLENTRLINIFVSRKDTSLIAAHEWQKEDNLRGWETFKIIFQLWKKLKKW